MPRLFKVFKRSPHPRKSSPKWWLIEAVAKAVGLTAPDAPDPDPSIPPRDGRCLLLELPGELRNMIYEYVLTEKHGIMYRPPNLRFGPFVSMADTQIQRLGSLVRYGDMVYNCNPNSDHNQLKYVNRQLHRETRGLGLQFNVLHFKTMARCFEADPRYGRSTIGLFSGFMLMSNSRTNKWLQKIVLHDMGMIDCPKDLGGRLIVNGSLEELRYRLTVLAGWCRDLPWLRFEVTNFLFRPTLSLSKWVMTILEMRVWLRGTLHPIVSNPAHVAFIVKEARKWGHGTARVFEGLDPESVKIFPTKGRFPVTALLKHIKQESAFFDNWSSHIEGREEAWLRLIENWLRNGI